MCIQMLLHNIQVLLCFSNDYMSLTFISAMAIPTRKDISITLLGYKVIQSCNYGITCKPSVASDLL